MVLLLDMCRKQNASLSLAYVLSCLRAVGRGSDETAGPAVRGRGEQLQCEERWRRRAASYDPNSERVIPYSLSTGL